MTAPKPTALPIFDGHNDMLLSLYLPDRGKGRGFFERGEEGHLDLPRMREVASAAVSSPFSSPMSFRSGRAGRSPTRTRAR